MFLINNEGGEFMLLNGTGSIPPYLLAVEVGVVNGSKF
jgi:hypothetical protein